jgi:hypothetical protein
MLDASLFSINNLLTVSCFTKSVISFKKNNRFSQFSIFIRFDVKKKITNTNISINRIFVQLNSFIYRFLIDGTNSPISPAPIVTIIVASLSKIRN